MGTNPSQKNAVNLSVSSLPFARLWLTTILSSPTARPAGITASRRATTTATVLTIPTTTRTTTAAPTTMLEMATRGTPRPTATFGRPTTATSSTATASETTTGH